jgi:hypothetical protein
MPAPEQQAFRSAIEGVRDEIAHAVSDWKAGGGTDETLVLHVDLLRPDQPRVVATTREQLELTIQDFDPSLPIELARTVPGRVPAVVDIHDYVRRVLWIQAMPPHAW